MSILFNMQSLKEVLFGLIKIVILGYMEFLLSNLDDMILNTEKKNGFKYSTDIILW